MFCSNCGAQIDDKAAVCIHCGVKTNGSKSSGDTGGFWWGVLGFFIPLAGLIIWLTCRDNTPKNAKSAGIGALISTILSVVLSILVVVFYVFIIAAIVGTNVMI